MGSSMKKYIVEQPKGFQDPRRNDEVFLVAKIYVDDIVFGFTSSEYALDFAKEMKDTNASNLKLSKDESGKGVEETLYRSMIGCLLYLTTSRPDITFSVEVCARYQACPKESHLIAFKRIIRKTLQVVVSILELLGCLDE
ncbi:hypothetical protein CK203_102651 [Vitis vinifera]|uniref:Retrovirus-related Pol polyprotein from transposon RE1 n=1 Tax=Vitis vinifera TaxID=29760 RepID=A0A438C681_VITVI|nr:hypothetical protein CK203_102651 [Vitis vinifera]